HMHDQPHRQRREQGEAETHAPERQKRQDSNSENGRNAFENALEPIRDDADGIGHPVQHGGEIVENVIDDEVGASADTEIEFHGISFPGTYPTRSSVSRSEDLLIEPT